MLSSWWPTETLMIKLIALFESVALVRTIWKRFYKTKTFYLFEQTFGHLSQLLGGVKAEDHKWPQQVPNQSVYHVKRTDPTPPLSWFRVHWWILAACGELIASLSCLANCVAGNRCGEMFGKLHLRKQLSSQVCFKTADTTQLNNKPSAQ